MSTNRRKDSKASLILPVGWLFADLLLALAMIFLVANTIQPPSPPKPTPTPKPTKVVVTPTPSTSLILDPARVTLILTKLDPDKLSNGTADAVTDLENKIREQITQKGLQNRRAGIAIAYGGADNYNQADRGSSVSAEVYKVLDMLGQQRFVFCHTLHYDPLFTLNHPHDTVVIDIYFFSPSVNGC